MKKTGMPFFDAAEPNGGAAIASGCVVSLVLSAYNGNAYIVDQLDSLRMQDRPLDEVLICDDGSTDGTPRIIGDYIERHRLNGWRIDLNEQNKGWRRNFRDLLYRASGELIFLCDQDDIWGQNKVSEMTNLMGLHPEIDVLACDVDPFYEEGSKSVPNVGDGANDGAMTPHPLDEKAVYVLRPGCAYCVRKSFLEEIEPYWDETWAHDAVLWELAQVKGSLALYDKRLVRFRRHEGNASARKKMTRDDRIRDIEDLIGRVALMRCFGADSGVLTARNRSILDDLDAWLHCRLRFLNSRDFRSLERVISGRSHYATRRGLLVDIALSFFCKLSL